MTSAAAVVARLDGTLLLRNGVAAALLISFAAMSACAIAAGALREARDRNDRSRLLALKAEAPLRGVAHLALERGTFAVLPPAPLPGIAIGQSDIYSAHYQITARGIDAQLAGDQIEHPLVLHAGTLDLLFVFLYFFPLIIVAASHDLLASDRATGTLRMLVAQGASLPTILRGRLRVRLLLIVLLPLAASAAAAVAIDVRMLWSPRFVLWTGGAIVYGLFWVGLALHVNARGGAARTNALALAALWLLFIVVMPAVVNLATRELYPVPSRVQLATALRQAARAATEQGSQTLGRYLEDHPSTGSGVEGMRQFYMLQQQRDAEMARQLRPVLAAFEEQLTRQAGAMTFAQYLTPTIVTHLALTDVAGTSGHRARAFAAQAARFQQQWTAHFPPDVLAETAPAPSSLPVFEFQDESFRAVARRAVPPLLVLVAVDLWLLWSGIRRFHAFDIAGGHQ